MQELRSYVEGRWIAGVGAQQTLLNPTTEEPLAQASSEGIDLKAALEYARSTGGPALRAMSFAERGAALKAIADAMQSARDELLNLGIANGGNTRSDAKFDVDGAIATLLAYHEFSAASGASKFLPDGEGIQLGRSARFHGQHILVPRRGVAVHINAFNFPAWGFAEKAAVALLAGMPVLSKPATSSAMVAHRVMQLVVEQKLLPEGALSFLVGSARDLVSHLGPQDVVAFTGSGDTGEQIRSSSSVIRNSVRVNVEADSLNAAVLGPDVEPRSDMYELFLKDVVRVGDPKFEDTRMGPLATRSQLADAREGVARLGNKYAFGGPAPVGTKGFFMNPTLVEEPSEVVHEREVFGPVAALLRYKDNPAEIVARGNGGLVSSVYSDDQHFIEQMVTELAPHHGRLFLGHPKIELSPGPGTVLPQLVHGGPGRAGGGEELGGVRGLSFYMQRTALEGSRPVIQKLLGKP